jgi:hypothetical protein
METTQTGVSQPAIAQTASTEDGFQSLFEKGAFEPEKPKAAESGVEARTEAPAAAAAEPTVEETAAPETGTEEQGEEYTSLDEFLSKNQIDADGFRSIPVSVKIDGETKLVPLQDVLKSYQLEGHVNNKSIELSNQQRAFEAERTQAQAVYNQQLQHAQTLGARAYQQLMGEYASINWDQLRVTDPIQWAVSNQEFQQRNAAIQQHLQQVAQAQQAETQRVDQERQKALPVEREKMLTARQEWRDETKFKAAREQIISQGKTLGFSDAELGAITDHRYMLALDKAARYDALQAKAPEAVRRVRAAPLMAKPGVRTNRDPQTVVKQQAIARLNKAPRDIDAQAAYFETLS